jgi:hypothetical protein
MTRATTERAPGRGRGRLWLRKFSSFDDENRADLEFWQRMTPDERVAIVEQLREEWWKDHGDGEQGLRRAVQVLAGA